MTAGLCGGGRCSELLAGFATARDRLITTQGDQLAEVLRAVADDPELALTERQRTALPAALGRVLDRIDTQPATGVGDG